MSYSKFFEALNFFAIGLLSCYLLRSYLDIHAAVASALVGFVASFIPKSRLYDQKNVQAAAYTGSFAGMSSSYILNSTNDFVALIAVGAIVLWILRKSFIGVGGKLGTVAFVTVAIITFYRNIP